MSLQSLSIYCAAMAAVLLLSGCASPKAPQAADTPEPPAAIVVLEETLPPVPYETGSVVLSEEIPPENQKVRSLIEEFAECYFEKDREGMKEYLTEDHGSLMDVSPYDPDQVRICDYQLPQSVTYELASNGYCRTSVVFYETPESDSYTYLSITLVMENEEWKIESYGLEK